MAVECWSATTATGLVRVVVTDRSDGDFHLVDVDPDDLDRRRRAVVDLPWTMLDEQHGTALVRVERPGDCDRARGDVAVTDATGAVLGVWVGDCAPVVVVTPHGRVAAVHAGWRGLAAGVLDVAVDAIAGAPVAEHGTVAYVGPCIGACCYEFGDRELTLVAVGVGAPIAAVAARTTAGRPALDVLAAVRLALGRRGIHVQVAGRCTRCDPTLFSHRAGDHGRQVLAVWRDPGAAA